MNKPFAVSLLSASIALALPSAFAAPPKAPTFDPKRLSEEVKVLSSDEFEGRGPATAGETRTIDYVVAQMKEAVSMGAFIEFVGGNPEGQGAAARLDGIADAIRQVGPASSILSSDLGQQGNPLPPDGFGAFIEALRKRGFSDRDLDVMSKQNPATLLGLK